MILIALLAAQAAAAPPTPARDIVVYGKRLDAAHRACLAGQCSVLRDAQVSIALAEQQLRDGAYVQAKKTMAAAVARNRRHAATDPKPVAALYEAYATVSLQEGDTDAYRRAVGGQVRTLRDNLPANDPARSDAALATGDMWLALRQSRNAAQVYAAVERQAEAAGDVRVVLLARVRRAWLAAARQDPAQARRLLRDAATGPVASDPALLPILRVAELRIAARAADDAAVTRLIGEIGHAAKARPALIWAPPYERSADARAREDAIRFGEVTPPTMTSSDSGTIQWADVGFWIRPDGRTRDAEVLCGISERSWIAPVLRQVAARRYTGVPDQTGQGVYRVERFTFRGTHVVPIGGLVRRRAGPRQLEVLDLTEEAGPAAAVK